MGCRSIRVHTARARVGLLRAVSDSRPRRSRSTRAMERSSHRSVRQWAWIPPCGRSPLRSRSGPSRRVIRSRSIPMTRMARAEGKPSKVYLTSCQPLSTPTRSKTSGREVSTTRYPRSPLPSTTPSSDGALTRTDRQTRSGAVSVLPMVAGPTTWHGCRPVNIAPAETRPSSMGPRCLMRSIARRFHATSPRDSLTVDSRSSFRLLLLPELVARPLDR
ncbi:Uncharacterised protein [Mycobacteroides abscessus subsp. abscessus]|nr:Uncharacterised protein [Mycobacteroides abscessus subsp. abscessus]